MNELVLESLLTSTSVCIIYSADLPVLFFCRSDIQLADKHCKVKLVHDADGEHMKAVIVALRYTHSRVPNCLGGNWNELVSVQ